MRLMPLAQVAIELGVKSSSLRTEIRKGTLRPIVVAGKYYFTDSEVGEMLEACRAKPRDHGSISDEPEPAEAGGSSSTENPNVALDAAKQTLAELKERSRRTSRANMSRDERQAT